MSLPSTANLGYVGLFGVVFLEQLGLPIPAAPALVAAGVLVAGGHLALVPCLVLAVAAAFLADFIWYTLGRRRGGSILNFICKFTGKPDSCIAKTKDLFGRYGAGTLLFAKFVPGLNTIAPPLAGMTNVSFPRFLSFNLAGCVIWVSLPLGAGVFFGDSLPSADQMLALAKQHLPLACVVLVVGFGGWRLVRRWYYRNDLVRELQRGISIGELKQRLEDAEPPIVLDVRHALEVAASNARLPQSWNIGYHELKERLAEIPPHRDVIVYCACPKDEGAVAAVQLLRKHGRDNARPLLGGLEAWRSAGLPLEPAA